MNSHDDVTGGWRVGDRVRFRPRIGFDAHLHHGVIVDIDVRGDQPVAHFTVQIDPTDGAGRVQLELPHLVRLPEGWTT